MAPLVGAVQLLLCSVLLMLGCALSQKSRLPFHVALVGDFGVRASSSQRKRNVINSLAKVTTLCCALLLCSWVAQLHAQRPFQLAVEMGDNVYPMGTPTGDPSELRKVFTDDFPPSTFNFSFLASLGNHDYFGDYNTQIQFGDIDSRWFLPHRYYHFKVDLGPNLSPLLFIVLDTTPIIERELMFPLGFEDWKQCEFLNKTLVENSDARYIFIVTHHSIFRSSGPHRSPPQDNFVAPLCRQHLVNAVISGHDHNLQVHWSSVSPRVCTQVIIGSTAKLAQVIRTFPDSFVHDKSGGFATLLVRYDQSLLTLYSEFGERLFSYTFHSRQ